MVIVEGLNGAGKSYWIEGEITRHQNSFFKSPDLKHLITSWVNPLRFNEQKQRLLGIDDVNKISMINASYIIGCYETIYELYKQNYFGPVVYFDRLFITAYCYNTITEDQFKYIVAKFQKMNIRYVFIDTSIATCVKRLKEKTGKDYVWCKEYDQMDLMRSKLMTAIDYASNGTFETIKGE